MRNGFHLFLLALSFGAGQAQAQTVPNPVPPFLSAGIIEQKDDRFFARNHATLRSEDGLELRADYIEINTASGMVRAEGNILLYDPAQDLLASADSIVTDTELRRMDMGRAGLSSPAPGRFILSGETIEKRGDVFHLGAPVFTLCPVCRESKNPALWKVQSKRAKYFPKKNRITATHLVGNIWDVPVFYLPYISLPTTLDVAVSGLLLPSTGEHIEAIGSYTGIPAYLTLTPNQDLTLIPIEVETGLDIIKGQYRFRSRRALWQWDGVSGKLSAQEKSKGKQTPYHHRVSYRHDINRHLRTSWEWHETNDKEFLPDYGINPRSFFPLGVAPERTINKGRIEWFSARNYASLSFQETTQLRGDSLEQMDYEPRLSVHLAGKPGKRFAGNWTLDGETTKRTNPSSSLVNERQSFDAGYLLSASEGHKNINLTVGGRYDSWNQYDNNISTSKGGREIPWLLLKGSYEWLYPTLPAAFFVKPGFSYYQAPEDVSNSLLPIEDASLFIPSQAGFFEGNRASGIDLFEGGQRSTAGVEAGVIMPSGVRASAFAGQSYREQNKQGRDETLYREAGIKEGQSPAFYALNIATARHLDFSVQREEGTSLITNLSLASGNSSLFLSYQKFEDNPERRFEKSEVFRPSVSYALGRFSLQAEAEYDLLAPEGDKQTEAEAHMVYRGSCFELSFSLIKDNQTGEEIYSFSMGPAVDWGTP